MQKNIIWGTQGRIELKIWHTGIGTRIMLYDYKDSSFYFGFSEVRPIHGPSDKTYTKAFVDILKAGAGELSLSFRFSVSITTIGGRVKIEGRSNSIKTIAFFEQKQIDELLAILIPYVEGLPDAIKDDMATAEQDVWAFYVDEEEKKPRPFKREKSSAWQRFWAWF